MRGQTEKWIGEIYDEAMGIYEDNLVSSADTLLLGRVTYQSFAGSWPHVPDSPHASDGEKVYARKLNTMHKVVFSRTLESVEWNNSTLLREIVAEDIERMKQEPGRLLVGLGSSCAAGIGMGKLIRGPLKRQVHKFDSALFAATRKIESPFMDRAMAVFSSLGEPSLLYSLSGTLALLWLVNGKGRESAALEFAVLGSATIDKVTKATIHRPRPYLKLPLARSRPSGSSFPSNHAMMSLTAYGALGSMSGRKRLNAVPRDTEYLPSDWLVPPAVGGPEGTPPILQVPSGRHVSRTPRSGTPDRHNRKRARKRMIRIGLALTLSAFVSWSRVYRGVHNPSDVLAGWILGGFWLSVCYSWRGSGR